MCSTSTCLSFLSRVLFQLISLNSFHFTAHQFSNLVSNFLSRYSQRHYVGNAPPEYLQPPALECSIAKAFQPSPLERVLILWSFLISVSISTFLFLSFCSREFETSSWCVFSFVALICRTRNNYLARFWFQLPFLPSPPSPLYHSARPSISFIAWKWSGAILVIVSSPRGMGEVGEGEWGSKSRGTFWLFYLSIWICCASFRISFFFFFVFSPLVCYLPCKRGVWGRGLGWQGAWFLTRFWLLLFSFLSSCSSTKHFFLCLHFCIKLKPHFPGIFPPLSPGTVSLSFFFSFSASICPFWPFALFVLLQMEDSTWGSGIVINDVNADNKVSK